MKRYVIVIASILQFVAAGMYIGIIKGAISWSRGETTDLETATFIVVIAVVAQALSTGLKLKHTREVERAEEMMQKPHAHYGWIALGIFGVVVLLFVVYLDFVG